MFISSAESGGTSIVFKRLARIGDSIRFELRCRITIGDDDNESESDVDDDDDDDDDDVVVVVDEEISTVDSSNIE